MGIERLVVENEIAEMVVHKLERFVLNRAEKILQVSILEPRRHSLQIRKKLDLSYLYWSLVTHPRDFMLASGFGTQETALYQVWPSLCDPESTRPR